MFPSQGKGPEFESLYPHHLLGYNINMNNGYGGRGNLRIKERPYKRLTPIKRNISLATGIVEPAEVPKDNHPISAFPSALPTISIYKCSPSKPCCESNLVSSRPAGYKTIDNTFILKPDDKRQIIKEVTKDNKDDKDKKSFISHAFYLEKPASESFDFEKEPPTKKVETEEKKHKIVRHRKPIIVRQIPLALALFIILGTTGYVSVTTWQTNNRVKQAISSSKSVASSNPSTESSSTSVDSDKSLTESLNNYKVAADLPRAIYINKINVAAKILPMGINDDNTLQAPTDALDTGWYTESAKPGQQGAILIDGHYSVDSSTIAVFNSLNNLSIGDQITIERGDGEKFTYQVVFMEDVLLSDVDMNKMLVTYNNANQGLNLITCSGNLISDGSTLDHRLLVYTVAI